MHAAGIATVDTAQSTTIDINIPNASLCIPYVSVIGGRPSSVSCSALVVSKNTLRISVVDNEHKSVQVAYMLIKQ